MELHKLCPKCGTLKPTSEFHKNKSSMDGLQYHCISCRKLMDGRPEKRKQDRERYHKNKDRYLDNYYKRVYGIDLETYQSMLISQQGVCAICNSKCSTGKQLAVDHDHSTGKVRGLLCTRCNQAIGLLDDNPLRMQIAINYLQRKFGATE